MSNTLQKTKPAESTRVRHKPKSPEVNPKMQPARGGKLKTKPVMVYPESPTQRGEFEAMATIMAHEFHWPRVSLSGFMTQCAQEYIVANQKRYRNWNAIVQAIMNGNVIPDPILA